MNRDLLQMELAQTGYNVGYAPWWPHESVPLVAGSKCSSDDRYQPEADIAAQKQTAGCGLVHSR